MDMLQPPDPLVGDELIQISLHPYHVYFTFVKTEVQLGVVFDVSLEGSMAKRIDPVKGEGDLHALWSLVGKVVEVVQWEDTISFVFTDGALIVIPSVDDRFKGTLRGARGTIKGRHDMTMEDF